MALFSMRDSWNVWRRKVNEALGTVEPVEGTNVTYDNTNSGLSATNVQSAIDEVAGKECKLTSYFVYPPSAVTVPNNVSTPVVSVNLPAGKYLLLGYVRFVANNTGSRMINIGTIEGWSGNVNVSYALATDSFATLDSWTVETYSESVTVYLNAIQTSGGNLDINAARLAAIKIE